MKVLIFASVPPPVHGQNVMVAHLLNGLKNDTRFEVFHVDPKLSRDHSEIGAWRLRKLICLLRACAEAWRVRYRHGRMAFYYVPAPAKRAAIVRDWIVMAACRPFFGPLLLHFHAAGLGTWLSGRASRLERRLSCWLLGRAALAVILDESLRRDVEPLWPRRIAVVANGVPDPGGISRREVASPPLRGLFLGLCSEEKGLFDLMDAIATANAGSGQRRLHLSVAGAFASKRDEERFACHPALASGAVTYLGSVSGDAKIQAFRAADVFCLPTRYPHEGQPLVLMEAMACGLGIVATRWRAIPSMVPTEASWLVEPGDAQALAGTLTQLAASYSHSNAPRHRYEAEYTIERHLERMKSVLLEADASA